MAPRHILDLSVEEQRSFIDSFDMVISDCDGVVWLLVGWIPGAGEAINALKNAGKSVKFVSNNSFRTDDQYMEKFDHIGAINVQHDDVVHPVKSIVRYLHKHKPGKRVYSLMSLEANETLRKHGIEYESLVGLNNSCINLKLKRNHITAANQGASDVGVTSQLSRN